MFGRRATVVAITKYLDTYLIRRKLFKALSSSFLKAVRKIEPEVVAKLEEGNKEDHARHEDYVLSFLEDPLKTQICSYLLNR